MIFNVLSQDHISGKAQCQPLAHRVRKTMSQPGITFCNNLVSLKEEVEKLNPSNKDELIEAIDKLYEFKNCSKRRS